MNRFCGSCGSALQTGARFCPVCGNAVPQGNVEAPTPVATTPTPPASPIAPAPEPPSSSAPPWTPVPPTSAPSSTIPAAPMPVTYSTVNVPPTGTQPQRRSPLFKLLAIALVIILVAGLSILAGILYVGYRVGQKATHAVKALSQAGASGALHNPLQGLGSGDDIPVLSASAPVTPCPPAAFPDQKTARIPLAPHTVLTNAWGIKYGDVELHNEIDSIDNSTFTATSTAPEYKDDLGKVIKSSSDTNQNCNADFQSAGTFITVNSHRLPRLLHDVTRTRLSDSAFQAIKENGKVNLRYMDIWYVQEGVKPTYEKGLLTRVEPNDLDYPMIVNDQRVTLPVIHLTGTFETDGKDPRSAGDRPAHIGAELFVLDDAADPLILSWRLRHPSFHAGNFRVEVIKINFPVAKPDNVLEQQLTQEKRAVTYGIYFDFAKATLKPESEPVLKEIAQALKDNPDWKLTVEGHTDNIGGDAYNLDLSKRRALAVKEALVAQYGIAPDRLANDGFGASRPVESNDTLQGRARNRRVELVRQ
jgi:outer membrane protein OmpA-like peptidoglycan-associated protein